MKKPTTRESMMMILGYVGGINSVLDHLGTAVNKTTYSDAENLSLLLSVLRGVNEDMAGFVSRRMSDLYGGRDDDRSAEDRAE